MWLLVIVLLMPVSHINQVTVLNTFRTYEGCIAERNRIRDEMQQSYPDDTDYAVECRPKDNKVCVPLSPTRLCT